MSFESVGLWLLVGCSLLAVLRAGRPLASRAAFGAAATGTVLLIRLGSAFAVEDWSFSYVADNARSGVGPVLRVAGLWAGPEGSLLLWTVMLAWVSLLALRLATAGTGPWAARLGSGLTAAYGLVVALAASPFHRFDVPPVDGLGLQPVLEYPAMVWHPPLLYAGLVGLLVPAIRGAAAALSGHPARLRPATLQAPLAVLAAGLLSGALWANVELGWGGYWAWDPIESAGLVAWLCGAAALHAARRPRAVTGDGRVAAALWIAPGLAALWATTLTRIGVVSSVHAFADRPALRVGLLAVASGASAAAALAVVAAQRRVAAGAARRGEDRAGAVFRPAGALSAGRRQAAAVLAAAALFVAVGAYEPLIEAATTGDAVAIAGRYYSRLLWPAAIIGCALAVRADRRWWPAIAGAAGGAAVTPLGAGPFGLALGAAGGAMAGSAAGTLVSRKQGGGRWGAITGDRAKQGNGRRGAVAHIGAGLLLVGVGGTVASRIETVDVAAGQEVQAAGVTLRHRSIELVDGPATQEAVATVEVDGDPLTPRLVAYPLRGASTAEVAHRFRLLDEIQILLIDGDATGARYRVNRLPRVGLVWLGGAILVVGLAAQPLRRLRASSSDRVDSSPSRSAALAGASAGFGPPGRGAAPGDTGTGPGDAGDGVERGEPAEPAEPDELGDGGEAGREGGAAPEEAGTTSPAPPTG